jgi:hypothetical protein
MAKETEVYVNSNIVIKQSEIVLFYKEINNFNVLYNIS